VQSHKTASLIINFLSKSNRFFGRIHFFDVTSAPACATEKVAKVTAAAIRQFFPVSKFLFVLLARSHRGQNITLICGWHSRHYTYDRQRGRDGARPSKARRNARSFDFAQDDNARRVVISFGRKFFGEVADQWRFQFSRENSQSISSPTRFWSGDRFGKRRQTRRGTVVAPVCRRRARR